MSALGALVYQESSTSQHLTHHTFADNPPMNRNILFALAAAALFGASTPFAKLLAADVPPVLLAGLLYLGSGIGLTVFRVVRDRGLSRTGLPRGEWPWLLAAVFFGGVAGPVALMFGLTSTSGSTASLLLNAEAVLTALIAWMVFREHADRSIVLGMAAIVAGCVVLSWPAAGSTSPAAPSGVMGPALIVLACLCWAIDNNLTRKVSGSDALVIASVKGVMAGGVNTALALGMGAQLPGLTSTFATMALGLAGYGISLVLFVLALRGLGTARTGAYFSTAPFIGAAVALLFFGEAASLAFWLAAALMGLGVWLHLAERHAHEHRHEPLEHSHSHVHDAHHQHAHDVEWTGTGAHTHMHQHLAIVHSHPHYPDIHHRHTH